jgi:hypothetical protein
MRLHLLWCGQLEYLKRYDLCQDHTKSLLTCQYTVEYTSNNTKETHMTQALAATFFDEISGELMVDVPQEIMDEIGITPGDVIVWNVDQNGRVTITKKTEE